LLRDKVPLYKLKRGWRKAYKRKSSGLIKDEGLIYLDYLGEILQPDPSKSISLSESATLIRGFLEHDLIQYAVDEHVMKKLHWLRSYFNLALGRIEKDGEFVHLRL